MWTGPQRYRWCNHHPSPYAVVNAITSSSAWTTSPSTILENFASPSPPSFGRLVIYFWIFSSAWIFQKETSKRHLGSDGWKRTNGYHKRHVMRDWRTRIKNVTRSHRDSSQRLRCHSFMHEQTWSSKSFQKFVACLETATLFFPSFSGSFRKPEETLWHS